MARVIISILAIYVFTFLTAFAESPGSLKHLLLIHSYHKGYSYTEEEERGILNALTEQGISFEAYMYFLDAKRFGYEKRHREVARHFELLYDNFPFDLVIVTDNDALNFAIQYRSRLFSRTPLVFTGINNFSPEILKNEPDITGVAENIDLKGTIDLARSLFPQRDYLVFIIDSTATGIALARELATLQKTYPSTVTFLYLWLGRLYFTEILELLYQYEERSIVFPLQMNIDRDGTAFSVEEAMRRVRGATSSPLFTSVPPLYQYGAIGGKIIPPYDLGYAAGNIAARILKGEKPASIPVQTDLPSRYVFDFHYLQKFQIPKSSLPREAEILNQPPLIWEQHAEIIPYILIILVFQSVTILLLFDALRRNKAFQEMLRKLLKEKELLMREVNHRVKNNLSTVKSLLSIQRSNTSNPAVHEALQEAENRIQSISLTHRLLYGSLDSKTISIRTYLEELIGGIKDSLQVERRGVQIFLDTPEENLEADIARNIGLIVNEAITNALKHAFNGSGGEVRIRLSARHQEGEKSVWVLIIEDNGKGIRGDRTLPTESLGFTIMESLAENLQGTLNICPVVPEQERKGTRILVEFPYK
ncbi:MAG: ABC transporter substrate binding protein [Spirochaetales bacterium]